MTPWQNHHNALQRRTFLGRSGLGLGSAALSSLLGGDLAAAPGEIPKGVTHFARRRNASFFSAWPVALPTSRPSTTNRNWMLLTGKRLPESFTKGQPIAQLQGKELKVLGHLSKFQKHGQSGQLISDYLPWTAKMADDIAVVRSMVTEQINHDPAHTFMNTGTAISGRPSMGAWTTYGLGSETEDLPGFVVLTSVGGRNPQPIASRQWSAGFLPSKFQGVEFNSTGVPFTTSEIQRVSPTSSSLP